MLCEEKLEVFQNGFEDGKFNLHIEFYGKDARKVLLAVIRELYLPEYGAEYVYPFECAKEFWGIPIDGEELESMTSNFRPNPIKFMNQSVIQRLKKTLQEINPPYTPDLNKSEVHRVGKGYIAMGRDFILDEGRGVFFTFNKPTARELILKYLGVLDEE